MGASVTGPRAHEWEGSHWRAMVGAPRWEPLGTVVVGLCVARCGGSCRRAATLGGERSLWRASAVQEKRRCAFGREEEPGWEQGHRAGEQARDLASSDVGMVAGRWCYGADGECRQGFCVLLRRERETWRGEK